MESPDTHPLWRQIASRLRRSRAGGHASPGCSGAVLARALRATIERLESRCLLIGDGAEAPFEQLQAADVQFVAVDSLLMNVVRPSRACGDFDKDGDPDLALAGNTATAPMTRIYRDDGGAFTVDAALPGAFDASPWAQEQSVQIEPFEDIGAELPDASQCALAWGDYDGDGDLDLALAGDTGIGTVTRVYRNDEGRFTDANLSLAGVVAGSLAWGDYDNDGDLDLAVAGITRPSGRISIIYRNDGEVFTDIHTGLTPVGSCSLAWGDYDNDGDLDLAMAGWDESSRTVSCIYRNQNGVFVDAQAGLLGVGDGSLAWGDYDADGDLDLALAGLDRNYAPASRVYRNDGGTFSDAGANLEGLRNCALCWGDYDNDGDLDLAVVGLTPRELTARIHYNVNGVFDQGRYFAPGMSNGALASGDYDNDGKLDLVAAGQASTAAYTALCRNYGFTFMEVGIDLAHVMECSLAWGDYDNDGDLDLALAGWEDWADMTSRIYRNGVAETNTPPTVPTGLSAVLAEHALTLNWSPASDAQTPQAGLTYNIRVGSSPGADDIVSAMADSATGWRRVPAAGNAQQCTSWTIRNVTAGTCYWSVQSIDSAFEGSQWAPEQQVVLETPPTIAMLEPSSAQTIFRGQQLPLSWQDTDPDDNATISLAWDPDTSATPWADGDHGWILQGRSEDPEGEDDRYVWNTGGMAPGTYSIWAVIDDGTGAPVYARAAGLVALLNRPPVAVAGPDQAGVEGQRLYFSAVGSSDSEEDALTYDWDFGDGITADGLEVSHVYADDRAEPYLVTLTVRDSYGAANSTTRLCTIANVAPTLELRVPPPPTYAGATLALSSLGRFTDPGFSRLPDSQEVFSCVVDWGDGYEEPATVTIVQAGAPGILTRGNIAASHVYDAMGDYNVVVTLSDDDGGSATASLPVVVWHESAEAQPDVSVESVHAYRTTPYAQGAGVEPQAGEMCLKTTVANRGGAATGEVAVTFKEFGGTWSETIILTNLDPGESETVTATPPTSRWNSPQYLATAEPVALLAEATRTNNTAWTGFCDVGGLLDKSKAPGAVLKVTGTPALSRHIGFLAPGILVDVKAYDTQVGGRVTQAWVTVAGGGPTFRNPITNIAVVDNPEYAEYGMRELSFRFPIDRSKVRNADLPFQITLKDANGQVVGQTFEGAVHSVPFPEWLTPATGEEAYPPESCYVPEESGYIVSGWVFDALKTMKMDEQKDGMSVPIIGGKDMGLGGRLSLAMFETLKGRPEPPVSAQFGVVLSLFGNDLTVWNQEGVLDFSLDRFTVDPDTLALQEFSATASMVPIEVVNIKTPWIPILYLGWPDVFGLTASIRGIFKGTVSASARFGLDNGKVALEQFELIPSLTVGGGIRGSIDLIWTLASVSGEPRFTLYPKLIWKADTQEWSLDLTGNAKIRMVFKALWWKEVVWIPDKDKGWDLAMGTLLPLEMTTQQREIVDEPRQLEAVPAQSQDPDGNLIMVRLVDADPDPYGIDADLCYSIATPDGAWAPLAPLTTEGKIIFEPTVAWSSVPLYGPVGTEPAAGPEYGAMAAWVGSDLTAQQFETLPASEGLAHNEIYVSCFEGTHWTTPRRLTNDLAADCQPQIAYDFEGNAWVTWSRSEAADKSDPNGYEIMVCKWDVHTGLWGEPQQLTCNDVADMRPQIAWGPTQTAKGMIAWTSRDAAGVSRMTFALYNETAEQQWYGPLTADWAGDVSGIALSKGVSSDLEVVASDRVGVLRSAQLDYPYGGEEPVWTWKSIQTVATGQGITQPRITRAGDRIDLAWVQDDGEFNQVRIASRAYQAPQFSEPQPMTNSAIDKQSPLLFRDATGQPAVVYRNVTLAGGVIPSDIEPADASIYGDDASQVTLAGLYPKLTIANPKLNADYLMEGQVASLCADLKNVGLMPAMFAPYLVQFYDGDPDAGGTLLEATLFKTAVPIGGSVVVQSRPFVLPAGAHSYFVRAGSGDEGATIEVVLAPRDVTGPTVNVDLPANASAGVNPLRLAFSEPVASFVEPDFALAHATRGPIAPHSIVLDEDGGGASLWFDEPLQGGDYTLLIRDSVADVHGNTLDGDGDGAPGGAASLGFNLASTFVVGHAFSNHSAFDENDPIANQYDDAAIASRTLPPGQSARMDGCTAYSKGLNGIMVDISGLANVSELRLDTLGNYFRFAVGTTGDPSAWPAAPAPSGVDLRAGAGVDGSDRVSITWPDHAIEKAWLRVTVLSAADGGQSGLPADAVFYLGSLPGDTSGNGIIDGADYLLLDAEFLRGSSRAGVDIDGSGSIDGDDYYVTDSGFLDGDRLPLLHLAIHVDVCEDRNADGVFQQEIDLPGIGGRTVFLDDGDGVKEPGEPYAVTGKDGRRVFADLSEGTYRVVRTLPLTAWQTFLANAQPHIVNLAGSDVSVSFGDYVIHAPAQPTGLADTAASAHESSLAWLFSPDADSYSIQRTNDPAGP